MITKQKIIYLLSVFSLISVVVSEISEGIVLLSDYEYDTAVIVDIDNEIINIFQ